MLRHFFRLCVTFALCAAQHSFGEEMIVALRVNGQGRGEALIDTQPDGSVRIGTADAAKLGFTAQRMQGLASKAEMIVLSSAADLTVKLDLDALSLDITAAAEWFERNVLSLSSRSKAAVSSMQDTHAWLNYSLASQVATSARPGANVDTNLVVSHGAWTLRSDQNAAFRSSAVALQRTHSSLAYDDLAALTRVSVGDVVPSYGLGTTTAKVFGLQWSRRFEFDPSINSQPTFQWSSQAMTPSTVDVFVDGVRAKTFSVAPGPFDLRDLAYFGGLRNVEVVIRDRAGVETRRNVPYYFSTDMLAAGRDSFDLSLGAPEGARQAREWVLAGQYRRGMNDYLTLGVGAEAKQTYHAARFDAGIRHELIGAATLGTALSQSRGERVRAAATLSHSWSSGRLSSQLAGSWQQEGFGVDRETMASTTPARQALRQISAGAAYSFDHQRSASINFSRSAFSNGEREGLASVRIAQGWGRSSSVWLSLARTQHDNNLTTAISLGISVPLGAEWSVSGTYAKASAEPITQSLRASRSKSDSEWADVRIAAEHRGSNTTLDGFAQRPFAAGLLAVAARADNSANQTDVTGEFRFSGALAWADTRVWWSRPIAQAFALVDAAGVPGVRVTHNNQLVGRTDATGKLLLPNLAAFTANQIRIDDRDIPMEIELANVQQEIAPRMFAGAKAIFSGKRVSAVAGAFQIATSGDTSAPSLAAAQITAISGATSVISSTDSDGAFYLENLHPGQWNVTVVNRQTRCEAHIVIPEASASFVNLGPVPCIKK